MLSLLLSLVPSVATPVALAHQEDPPKLTLRQELENARANAEKKNRRVLLMLFQEWHGPSSALADLLRKDEELQHELLYEYDLVVAHLQLDPDAPQVAREHGLDPDALPKPHLAVLDAQGNVVAQEAGSAFEVVEGDARKPDPKKVLDFLAKHQAPYLDAEVLLRGALAKAKETNRRLLVHAGAPW